jgi:crossover junction endodeoxyribonuclease RuvC
MVVIGIDLGLTGAVGFVGAQSCSVADLPIADGALGKRIEGRGLSNLLLGHEATQGTNLLAVFEDVQPRPMGNSNKHGNTMYSQGSLMRSRGTVEGVLAVLGIPWVLVQPQAWKDWYGLLKADKKTGLAKARQMFPDVAHQLTRVSMDHNRADALLIAHYVLRTKT